MHEYSLKVTVGCVLVGGCSVLVSARFALFTFYFVLSIHSTKVHWDLLLVINMCSL